METVKIGNWSRGLHTNSLEKQRPMLNRVAKEHGLDPTVLYAMANIESGFDPNASNTNYGGLFAINKKTHAGKWQDPEYNAREAIKLYRQNENVWKKRFGDDKFTPGKAYLLHQQGAGGGTALYAARNSNKSAASVLAPFYTSSARKAGLSPEEYVRERVIKPNGADGNISAKDFANMWINRADALQSAYAGKKFNLVEETPVEEVGDTDPKKMSSISTLAPTPIPKKRQKNLWEIVRGLFRRV